MGFGDIGDPLPVGALPCVDATFSIPGVAEYHADASDGVSYTRTLGMSPNFNSFFLPGTLADYPHLTFGVVGTLTIKDGLGRTATFKKETIHELADVSDHRGGQSVRVVVKDKRYFLNRGAMVGAFNVLNQGCEFDEEGAIIGYTTEIQFANRASLRELIVLCFDNLGLVADDYNLESLKYLTQDDVDAAIADGVKVFLQNGTQRDPVIGDDIQIFPAVQWDWDRPAMEIERLLDDAGFAISLWSDDAPPFNPPGGGDAQVMAGKLVAVRLGKLHASQLAGFTPPAGTGFDFTEDRYTSTNQPPQIVVVGGRIVRQVRFDTKKFLTVSTYSDEHIMGPDSDPMTIGLEPVGLDLDGTIKPLAELSYAMDVVVDPQNIPVHNPYGRFAMNPNTSRESWVDDATDPTNYNIRIPTDVFPAATLDKVREAAHQSVWKWYRLPKTEHWQLPILPQINRTRNVAGNFKRREPIVYVGEYGLNSTTQKHENLEPNERADKYTIDFELGIVKLEAPAVRKAVLAVGIGLTADAGPAKVELEYAYNSTSVHVDEAEPNDREKWIPTPERRDFYHFPWTVTGVEPEDGPQAPPGYANWPPGDPWPVSPADAEFVKRPDRVLFVIDDVELNREDLDKAAMKDIRQKRLNDDGFVRAPEGNIPITVQGLSNDGIFRQLTWSVSTGAGAETSITANRERSGSTGAIAYRERLFNHRLVGKLLRDDTFKLASPEMSPNWRAGGTSSPTNPSKNSETTLAKPLQVAIANTEAESIPAGSFVEIVGAAPSIGVVKVRKPAADGSGIFLVTLSTLGASGGIGWGAHTGAALVRCDIAVIEFDIIGPGFDTAGGQDPYKGYSGGTFKVIGRWSPPPPGPPPSTAGEELALILLQSASTNVWIGVVVEIEVHPASGAKQLTIEKRLSLSVPHDHGGTQFAVWGGFETEIVLGESVVVMSIQPIPGEPIVNVAIPMPACHQDTLDLPDTNLVTHVVQPDAPDVPADPCLFAPP